MKFKSSTVVADSSDEGVWVDFDTTSRVKVARANNRAYRKCVRSLLTPTERRNPNVFLSEDRAEEIAKTAASQTILLGMKGFQEETESGDTLEIEYSPEKALELFNKFPYFYDEVVALSNDDTVFQESTREARMGN